MKMHNVVLHGPLALSLLIGACGDDGDSVDLVQMSTYEYSLPGGSRVPLAQVLGTTATLFLTLDPECPMTLGYAPMFDSLQYALPEGVRMVGFYPAPFIVADSADLFAQEHGFVFTQLMDPDCRLANALHARVTPEAFLVGADGLVWYRGAIDDSAVREGRKRIAVKHYVIDALRAVSAGAAVAVKTVPALGCIVECDGSEQQAR